MTLIGNKKQTDMANELIKEVIDEVTPKGAVHTSITFIGACLCLLLSNLIVLKPGLAHLVHYSP